MKVIAINGSPRKDGNTGFALEAMREELEKEKINVEVIHIGDKAIHGCMACGHCSSSENNLCVFKNDPVNETMLKMREADGMIIGSPTYYGSIAGTLKCFLDRVFFASNRVGNFKHKVGAAVVAVRRSGGVDVYNQINNYFNLLEMILPPSQYWVVGHGMDKGEIARDAEGMQTIRKNAAAMAWVLKMREATRGSIAEPRQETKVFTNFIR